MSIIIKSGSSGFTANVDSLGNITTLATPAALSSTAAPWSSATVINTAQILMTTGGYPAILLQLNQTSTITGGVVTYEGTFDGINWISLPTTFVYDPLTLAASPNPYTLTASTNHSVLLQTGGFQQVRVRLSTAIIGSGTVTLYWTAQSQSPLASSGSTTIAGTLSSNIAQIGGTPIVIGQAVMAASMPVVIASDQSSIPVSISGSIPVTQSTSPWVISGNVGAPGVLDPNNSSTTTLGAGSSFIGVATDILSYVSVRVIVFADVDSAANGLMVEFSEDGTNWDIQESVMISGGDAVSAPFGREARYFRIVYTNGATPQGSFRLQSILQPFATQISRNFLGNLPQDTDSAQVTQAVIVGHNTTGGSSYVGVKVTPAGAVSVNPPNNASTNITQVGGSALALGQTVSASSIPVVIASDQSAVPVTLTSTTITGTVNTQDASDGTPGTAAPSTAMQVAGWDGTDLRVLSTDTTGKLNVNVSAIVADNVNQGNAGTNAQAWWVQIGDTTNGPAAVTVGGALKVDGSAVVQPVSGTVTANQGTSPWVVSLTSTTITGTVAVTQSTSPWVVSGTVTANAGTGNFTVVQGTAASLNATVVGTGTFAVQAAQSGTWNINTLATITNPVTVVGDSASGAANAGNPVKTGGVFNTTQPTVTNGQTVDAQFTARGAQIVATGVDAFTVAISGTVAVTQSTSPWVVSLTSTTITGTVAVTQSGSWTNTVTQGTAANLNATVVGTGTFAVQAAQSGTWNIGTVATITNPVTVVGDAASGSAKAGNPVQGGAVFNTTQPTVTTGQVVENQATARGGLIVSTGVDTFNVTVNAALPAGTNQIGHVITDTGSTTAVTGTVAVTQSGTWNIGTVTTLTTITNAVTVSQGTAANLNATVVGTGTFAVQAAQSGTWTVQQGGAPWSQVGTLTHNNAAPTANNVGVLPAVASTAAPTYTTGDQVLLSTDLAGNLRTTTTIGGTVAVTQSTSPWVVSLTSTTVTNTVAENLTQVAGTALGATAVTNFGTAPAAAAVMGVNASIYAGTTGITATGSSINANITNTVPVTLTSTTITGTVAVTQSTSPWVVNMSQWGGTTLGTPTAFGTTPGAVVVGAANVSLFQGTAVISNTNPTFASITDGTTKVTVIAATAALKTDLSSVAGTATVTAAAGVQKVGIVGNAAATLDSANTAATAPTNALLTSAMYNSTVPALTNGQAVAAECDTTGSLYQNAEGRKQTYRVGVVGFTPIASASAPTISITGSATKTVRISRIRISITAGTGTACDISLLKFTALSGGTANSQSANIAKMDSGNSAQTAVVNQWSAAATTHTSAGILNAERYEIVTAAVSVLPGVIEWTFGDKNGQALVLRGTSEFTGILISAVGTTPLADCWVEWTEE